MWVLAFEALSQLVAGALVQFVGGGLEALAGGEEFLNVWRDVTENAVLLDLYQRSKEIETAGGGTVPRLGEDIEQAGLVDGSECIEIGGRRKNRLESGIQGPGDDTFHPGRMDGQAEVASIEDGAGLKDGSESVGVIVGRFDADDVGNGGERGDGEIGYAGLVEGHFQGRPGGVGGGLKGNAYWPADGIAVKSSQTESNRSSVCR